MMWRVTGRMSTGEGWVTLSDFFVEADSVADAQAEAVAVHTTGRVLAGPIDFAVHNPVTDEATPGQILIKGPTQRGVYKLV